MMETFNINFIRLGFVFSPDYDRVAHFFAAACLAVAAFIIFNTLKKRGYINWSFELLLFAVFSIAVIGGALYEVEEYLEDKFYWGHQFRLGDGPDTADDIMFDMFGGGAVAVSVFVINKINDRKNS